MNRTEKNKNFDKVLQAAQAINMDQLHATMRYLCQNDLFFLLTRGCGRVDIDRDWLYERCVEVQENSDGYIDLWAREHYKALPLSEPVPTPSGWKPHGELRVGDRIFGADGKPTRVIATTEVFTKSDCYLIEFSDGTHIRAGADHLWKVGVKSRKRIRGTGKRRCREYAVVSTEDISGMNHAPDKRISIDVTVAIRAPRADLAIDPYVLGAWLGDGHSASARITCSYKDNQIINEIKKIYPVIQHRSPNKNTGLYAFGNGIKGKKGTGITPLMRKMGVIGNKHIPKKYLRASSSQRKALMQGLMDTDGHCSTKGTCVFVNKNASLTDDVYELACTLGLNPNRMTHIITVNKKPYPVHKVSFQGYKSCPVFRLDRKLERCKDGSPWSKKYVKSCEKVPGVPVSCIQVDNSDGLYIAGKDFLLTHNSTIITFGKTIQDILNNPEITVGIFSHTKPIARSFLRQIKHEFEGNARLKLLFPEILHENHKQAQNWSEDKGITVKRKTNPNAATVEAHGLVDGQPTSKHFSLSVYDDVVTKESVTTPEMISKVTESWALSLNLGAEGGARRYIGTRYHFNDTYKTIMDREAAKPRIHPATVDGTPDGEPVFLTKESLVEKRKDQGSYVFACQQLQNPKADNIQGFSKKDMRFYQTLPKLEDLNIYFTVDPANDKKKRSDYTVLWVIGLGVDNNYYVIHFTRQRLGLAERGQLVVDLHKKYRPKKIGYEEYGMQADIQHIEYVQEQDQYRFDITPLGGSMAKTERIRKLVPIFEDHRIWFPEEIKVIEDSRYVNLVDIFINDELEPFPVCAHDDMLDSLARILDPNPDWAPKFPVDVEKYKPRKTRKPSASW